MYKPVQAIEVRIWGRTVGAVALAPNLGYYAFEYDRRFLTSGIELAPLAMPLAAGRAPFVFADLPELSFKRLPALLADALPDDFGNALIDAWMAGKGIDKQKVTPLDRLAYMGKRGMGALEFKPARTPATSSSTAIKLSRLVESARQAVHGELGSDHLAKAALAQIISVGTSAGGRGPRRRLPGIRTAMRSGRVSSRLSPVLSTGCSSSMVWGPTGSWGDRRITAVSNTPTIRWPLPPGWRWRPVACWRRTAGPTS
jgi:hypothetical protein